MTTARTTRATPRRNRDAEILDAATSVFSQKGYSTASLQDIAERVGILKGSLYHYISSKESLLFRILEESHASAQQLMDDVDALNLPTTEKFTTYIDRLAKWYLENHERASLYLNEWRYLEGDYGRTVRAQRRAFTGYVVAMIDDAIADGTARPRLDTVIVTNYILSAISSIPSWYRSGPPADIAGVAQQIASVSHSIVFRDEY
ncbi:TetR/AcrR family transcriptional regulator [Diaminobutyricimonas sp. LJ205]|uniref:TetR/AcrR family transcriptional regulator n=1 Tax=Diaminobutyricimonas sp. LJ205 TaxID=2683590 RepID=UPI0012F4A576|nr:TetR/AcrR family transcriptional regulator [Diaminobutyricimonas sp. LJ205]